MTNLLDELKSTKEDKPKANLLDELKARAGTVATPFNPAKDGESGDGIQGVFTEKWTEDSDYSGEIPVWLLETDDGAYTVKGYHTVLRQEMLKRESNLNFGDTVAVVYDGQKEPKKKGQNGAHIYRVGVRKADGSPI